jgi:hypothetical protein
MKLRAIAEAKSRTIIRDTGEAMGDLIQFIYGLGKTEERAALEEFLREPTARGWDKASWVVESAMRMVAQDEQNQDRIKKWNVLKAVTSPVVSAAVYDIDPKYVKGTSLQQTALPRTVRDRFKMAMGPQGYIGTMANAGQLPASRLKGMLKSTAQSGTALVKASQKAVPGIKPVARF